MASRRGRSEVASVTEAARALELEPPTDVFANVAFHFNLARAYASAAEPDAPLKQVEHLLTVPSDYKANDFRRDPVWEPIRKDPRFQKLLETKQP